MRYFHGQKLRLKENLDIFPKGTKAEVWIKSNGEIFVTFFGAFKTATYRFDPEDLNYYVVPEKIPGPERRS